MLLQPSLVYANLKRKKLLSRYKNKKLNSGIYVSIKNSEIGNFNCFGDNVQFNFSKIGDHSYINSNTTANRVEIGKFCSIGANIKFGLGKHPTHLISTHPAFYSKKKPFQTFSNEDYYNEYEKVVLGNDVWIGSEAIIMSGVTIGNGAIVAAGAVVTKNVKPYEIVGGVPAKNIKFRFDAELIEFIEKSEWWNESEEFFKENYKIFLDNNEFIKYFKNRN
ncbi:UNVERIFIED_CONTAM: hypothetical protein GTU68_045561 [Idotea baltica]|nr:hypothetical protein [Idotea baltica]